eukprot:SAG31_NODE_1152_length_9642_cov_4.124489_7_plen_558_part_00
MSTTGKQHSCAVMSSAVVLALLFLITLAARSTRSTPLACQPNAEQPMLPIFHLIGNVSQTLDGHIALEQINDVSGITYHKGLWHAWHQCCQDHWDHAISKDLMHWQRLPPPIQPLTTKTWDGSISLLPKSDGGPLILYDAEDGKLGGSARANSADRQILGVARLADLDDKYLMTWQRAQHNPVRFTGQPLAFPGQVWRNGEHFNFLGGFSRYQTSDSSFRSWTNMGLFPNVSNRNSWHACGGQWWVPVPSQIDGRAPPATGPNRLVNVGMGDQFLFGSYHPGNETFAFWSPQNETPARQARLEHGTGTWFAAQGGLGPAQDRMMILGWATPDYHGPSGGTHSQVNFNLSRLTLLREVHYDAALGNLVSNPVAELRGLRTPTRLAHVSDLLLQPSAPVVIGGTEGGAAAAADVEIVWSGFSAGGDIGACVLSDSSGGGGSGLGIVIRMLAGVATAKVGACPTVMHPQGATTTHSSTFTMLESEDVVAVRILPDRSVADFFVQGGRWAATVAWASETPRAAMDSAVVVWAQGEGVRVSVDAWGMGCGWVDPSFTERPTM